MMIASSGMRMKILFVIVLCICPGFFASTVFAADPSASLQWDRGDAMAAANSVNIDRAVFEIANVSALANAEATLEKLNQLETRSDWPMPAREAALYEFTLSLAELPRTAVAPEVMQHLHDYQVRTLVPDADHGATLVPLFNIRGAAAGVENNWQRKEFAIEAIALIRTNPATLVNAYAQSTNHNQRSGYLDSLRQADMADVAGAQQAALAKFEQTPELTAVIGLTAVLTADPSAVRQLLVNGNGAGLSATLRQLAEQLPAAEIEDLLTYAIIEAPAANASLAIAAWWPGLKHVATVRDLLLEQLADPALGSAAALALAQSPDVQTVKLLQQTAAGNTLAARRAQLALAINREQLIGETQP
jgi:hypothetical protein